MSAIIVDITDVPNANVDQEAVLLGKQADQLIRIEELSRQTGLSAYCLLSSLTRNLPRIVL